MQDHLFEACNKSDPLDPSCCNEATRSLNALPSRRNRACSSESFQIKISNSRNTCPTCCSCGSAVSENVMSHVWTQRASPYSYFSEKSGTLCVCQVPGSHKHLQTKQKTTFQVLIKSHLVMKLSIHPPHDAGFQSLAPCAYLDPSSTKHLRSSSFLEL